MILREEERGTAMDDVKEWLQRGRKLDAEIKQLEKAKIEAFVRASGGAVDTSVERVQGGGGNATEKKILKYIEYVKLIDECIEKLTVIKTEILKCINDVDNPTYRAILIAYYVNNQTWEKVAEDMRYNLRWVYRVHKKALKAIESHYKSML